MASKAQIERKSVLGRSYDEIFSTFSPERQARINARSDELFRQVDGLQHLRKIAEKSQKQVADKLGIKQPSVVKMEKQADLYISTLRKYVAAAGGKLTLMVEFPEVGTFEIKGLGDLIEGPEEL
jgi:DNA-binding XRE family transcriptional regulator